MKKRIEGVTVYAIDIGKNTFHVVGLDSSASQCCTPSSDEIDCSSTSRKLLQRLSAWRASRITVAGTQAPGLGPRGQDHPCSVRKTLCQVQQERYGRPEQSARQALHRVRDRYMSQRTGLINQMLGFLLEFGIAVRRGAGVFRSPQPLQSVAAGSLPAPVNTSCQLGHQLPLVSCRNH
jgi:transposase